MITTSPPLLSWTCECESSHVLILRFAWLNHSPCPSTTIRFTRGTTGHRCFNRHKDNPRRESRSPGPHHCIAIVGILRKVGVPVEDSFTRPFLSLRSKSPLAPRGSVHVNSNVFFPIHISRGSDSNPTSFSSGGIRRTAKPHLSSPCSCRKRSLLSRDWKLFPFHRDLSDVFAPSHSQTPSHPRDVSVGFSQSPGTRGLAMRPVGCI